MIVLFSLAAILLFVAALVVISLSRKIGPSEVTLDFALLWTMRAVGGFIAAIAAFGLLLCSLGRESFERHVPFTLPLIGGLLLTGAHWSLAIAIGVIVAAALWRGIVGAGK